MTARSALDSARPVLARMDASRGLESTKADLIQVWDALESAVRALLGNSAAKGQALIRDARARQLLTFDQANALIAFLAVREQLDRPGDTPTDADVDAARTAFLKLDAGLVADANATPAQVLTAVPPAEPPGAVSPLTVSPAVEVPVRKRSRAVPVTVGIVALAAIVLGGWMMRGRRGGSSTLDQGVTAYQRGDQVTASTDFERATREEPNDPTPHIYLARMAREVGNFTIANQELQAALRADPGSLVGRREYGSFFLAEGNYDQARVWYLHALEVNESDAASQGWLGCALVKLGRSDEAKRWFSRAGKGPWSACGTAAPSMAPGNFQP